MTNFNLDLTSFDFKRSTLETTFKSWAEKESETEEQKIENSIRMVKEAIKDFTELRDLNIEIFPQGSYPNNTNVKNDSDVDICVMLQTTIFRFLPPGLTDQDVGLSDSDYKYPTFKNHVHKALLSRFGALQIALGDKAIKLTSNSYRLNADVLPCFEFREYSKIQGLLFPYTYDSGIRFFSNSGKIITSWPKQHLQNGKEKNKRTNYYYKKVVKIFKGLNSKLEELGSKKLPSVLLDSLAYNVPDMLFLGNSSLIEAANIALAYISIGTLDPAIYSAWLEVSEKKLLFGIHQTWSVEDAKGFAIDATNYISSWLS